MMLESVPQNVCFVIYHFYSYSLSQLEISTIYACNFLTVLWIVKYLTYLGFNILFIHLLISSFNKHLFCSNYAPGT